MPTRLRVDYSPENNWRDFLVVLTAVCGGAALSLACVGWWHWARIAGFGFLGSLIPLGLELLAGLRRRRYVTVTPEAFILHERGRDQTIRDDQVLGTSVLRKEKYQQEILTGVERTLLVWVETPAGSELVRMANLVEAGQSDPLQELIQRLQTRVLTEAREAVAGGGACSGAGWTLETDRLAIDGSVEGEPRNVPLCELTAVAVIDNAVCVWWRGADEPVLRVPLETANSAVLLALLEEMLPEDEAPAPPADSDQLGRLLFERRPDWGMQNHMFWVGLTAGMLLSAGTALVKAGALTPPAAIGVGSLVVTLCVGAIRLLSRSFVLRAHEHGVWCKRLLGEQRMPYADLEAFCYNGVRQLVNGVYVSTRFELEFVPRPGTGRRPIRFKVTVPHSDDELVQLRERVSRLLAARMLQQFQSGQPVPWTRKLRFLPEGLEVAARGWLFRRGPQLIPYDEITDTELKDGVFSLRRTGQSKPAATAEIGERNFFPGYVLLTTCLKPQPSEDEGPSEPPPAVNRLQPTASRQPLEPARAV